VARMRLCYPHAMRYSLMNSSIGLLTIASTENGLAAIHFGASIPTGATIDEAANRVYTEQLEEYFEGRRTQFDFPLDFHGTPFQVAVWRELVNIPYGETRTYGEIAKKLGRPGAARAVGMANHDNPIAIVIPCHRVVGHDGMLTGYAGGLPIKRALLTLEQGQGQSLFT
jgi:methylated-DNA-[protein]-cysteine S-methyltransferase